MNSDARRVATPQPGMNISDMLFCSHPVSRLLLGFGLLLVAITTTSMLVGLLLAVLAGALIRMLDGNWRTTMRLLGLLRWFVIPILLLHMLFTPGQLLLPGWPLAVSREGLMQGIWLSIHLADIYAMAVLMFRLLGQGEWLRLLMLSSRFGERLTVQAFMIISMQQHMVALLAHLRRQFRLRHGWKNMPLLLMTAFKRSLADAPAHAQMLWLRWPQHPGLLASGAGDLNVSALRRRLFSTLWAACGCAELLLPWLT